MLTHVLTWWLRQMMSLIPPKLRRARGAQDAVIVRIDRLDDEPEGSEGAILVRRGGQETYAGPLRIEAGLRLDPAPSLAKVVRLPAGLMLRREVFLPLAAERDLATVLGFEMDRLTPFTPDEIYWAVCGVRREPPRGLRLDLLIALRGPLERLLTALAGLQLRPAYLESGVGRIALSPAIALRGRGRGAALYGLCAVLAVACVAIPVIRQQVSLDAVQTQMAALAPAEHEAVALRQRLSIAASGQAAIAAAERHGDTLQILSVLTKALPDGTFLTDFTLKAGDPAMNSRDLTIDGESADAARLIGVLSGAPGFQNPRFVAPVTRAINGQADLFSIRVAVAQ
jgi:general secretion pathway protein L